MELRIKLNRKKGDLLPINYQYQVSSWIYRVIGQSDANFSYFLHNQGFQTQGRNFKLFTFSQLDVRPYRLNGNLIQLLGDIATLKVRFYVEDSLTHFIHGLFQHQKLVLINQHTSVHFDITSIELSTSTEFEPTMHYTCLSPICVSKLRDNGTTEYLHPADKQFGVLLLSNLQRKAEALNIIESPISDSTEFRFRLLNNPRKKGIHIKESSRFHTQIIGYLFDFEITAPLHLHKLGYYGGFGEKNSLGFGCVETQNII